MAWIFSVSAECGPDRTAAERFRDHFAEAIVEGRATRADLCESEGAWWCVVAVPEIDPCDPVAQGRAARQLRDRLRSSPPFRFAHVGVEVDLFRTWEELRGERFDHPAMNGVVLSLAAFLHAGSPADFVEFRPGYVWRPA